MARHVLHISTECYPAAKAGGMGDVVGALPLYQPKFGYKASVIIPKYTNKWISNHKFNKIRNGRFVLEQEIVEFGVFRLKKGTLPFDLYAVDIPGKFDRASIYLDADGRGFADEISRNLSFQRAVCYWLSGLKKTFDIIHCHDHQVSFIPYFMKYDEILPRYRQIPSFYTIHNAQYNSRFTWAEIFKFPNIADKYVKILDWDKMIDGFASAVKCAWKINTVSPQYLSEIINNHTHLSPLFKNEEQKMVGIINGIDELMWNPKTDSMLDFNLKKSIPEFKYSNRKNLSRVGLSKKVPLIGFIGRFTHQKGIELLLDAIEFMGHRSLPVSFYILGSGDKYLEDKLTSLIEMFPQMVDGYIGYNESLAHKIYASTDFLVMPSRFEPCGLNQMFAMRYGSIPIVHATGGLIDTVPDILFHGNGIQMLTLSIDSIISAVQRALDLYSHKNTLDQLTSKITELDWSWNNSAKKYCEYYDELIQGEN